MSIKLDKKVMIKAYQGVLDALNGAAKECCIPNMYQEDENLTKDEQAENLKIWTALVNLTIKAMADNVYLGIDEHLSNMAKWQDNETDENGECLVEEHNALISLLEIFKGASDNLASKLKVSIPVNDIKLYE